MRHALVAEVALAFWHMARNGRRFEQVDRDLAEKDALAWTEEDHLRYSRFLRYKTATDRAFHTTFKNVEYLRKARMSEAEALRKARMSEAEALRRVEWAYEQWQIKESREMAKIEVEHARLALEVQQYQETQKTKADPSATPTEKPKDSDFPKIRELIRQQNEKRNRET